MIIRVRSNVGIWRVTVPDGATPEDVLMSIQQSRPHVVYETPLCSDPACQIPLDGNQSLVNQRLSHGSMIHCKVDPSTCTDVSSATSNGAAGAAASDSGVAQEDSSNSSSNNANTNVHMKRVIDADGRIKLVPIDGAATNSSSDRGFRKGMMALRDIKKAWTLNEFMALDSQFEFKLQRQPESVCQQVSLDIPSTAEFQAYWQRMACTKRFGILYGHFLPASNDPKETKQTVKVEAIYEPPQRPDPEAAEGFEQLEDPLEQTVEQIATLCGLKKVGWIFGHEPSRRPGLTMTAAEIIMAAEYQLEAAGGVNETPFCTIKVSKGEDGNVSVEAFQVSQQCMAMVAEEALEIGLDEGVCQVNETFTAIQEGKESKTVENSFFLTVVPIVQHTSETFVAQFPRIHRAHDFSSPSKDELKKQLSKSGTQGWTFMDLLADFNLLIYLASSFLDVQTDMPKICQSVVNREIPLDDGYKIIIASIAGLDTAY
jgi:nuclear protein localization protein 4 homolog